MSKKIEKTKKIHNFLMGVLLSISLAQFALVSKGYTDEMLGDIDSSQSLHQGQLQTSGFKVVDLLRKTLDPKALPEDCALNSNLIQLTPQVEAGLRKVYGNESNYCQSVKNRIGNYEVFSPLDETISGVNRRIILISDAHLCGGSIKGNGKDYDKSDDFTEAQENQFVEFMKQQWKEAEDGEVCIFPEDQDARKSNQLCKKSKIKPYKIVLNLNGDVVDFLQTIISDKKFPYDGGINADGSLKNNTANNIAQLKIIHEGHPAFFKTLATHLQKGHLIDLIPGNHDRHFYHPAVFRSFKNIIKKELESLNLSKDDVNQAINNLQLKPFAIYGNIFIEHGDTLDPYNKVQRPYKEYLDPSSEKEEMSMALGDYGVRGGFNQLEQVDNTMDNRPYQGPTKMGFWSRLLWHPIAGKQFVSAFISAIGKEGCEAGMDSEKECKVRAEDYKAIIKKQESLQKDLIELAKINNLSYEEMVEKFGTLEENSAHPLYSLFAKDSYIVTRLYKLGRGQVSIDKSELLLLLRMELLHKYFGIVTYINGHTHRGLEKHYLNQEGKELVHINSHTWTSQLGLTVEEQKQFGQEGRGVVIIQEGTKKAKEDGSEKKWNVVSLGKVTGPTSTLSKLTSDNFIPVTSAQKQ